ncbi:hypothetical protein ACSBOB_19985 [Mesorhizobium sp. ASY16-5R]|uniref:hypothetical protein n=1 Tax=Mesorhizobium sp. ASY16-5R TaxID=3445772 RepID=UPI003FA02538
MNLQTFDVDIAHKYGLEPAILFQAIGYWCNHNKSKPDRQRDGKAWMYMSRREWLEEFSFIGEGTLRSSLQKLVDAGLVQTANYSEGMYARTTWYCVTDLGWDLWLKQPIGSAESAKGFGQNSQTITDTNSTTTISLSAESKPTKAPSRANPRIRLVQFFADNPNYNLGWREWAKAQFRWDDARVKFEWDDFCDYWTSGNAAGGGLKSDWPATWRSHCRRVSGLKGRGPQPAGGTSGQGGGKRYDVVAAAGRRAVAELFGIDTEGHGGAPAPVDPRTVIDRDREDALDAVFGPSGSGDETRQLPAPTAERSDTGGDGRVAVPEPVE